MINLKFRIKLKQAIHYSSIYEQFEKYFKDNKLALLIVESIFPKNSESSLEDLIIYETTSLLTDDNYCCDRCYPFDHTVMRALNGPVKNKRIARNGKIPYILSGCTAILVHEPCTMCSMALLHSRIDGVIYMNSNIEYGAMGSICFLHSMDSLNHRFPVFEISQ